MGTKRNGLLALLGLGALAFWKYKTSTPEEQQAVKDKLNTAKDNLGKLGNELKTKASDVASQVQNKANEYANKAENKASEFAHKAENKAEEVKSDVNSHM